MRTTSLLLRARAVLAALAVSCSLNSSFAQSPDNPLLVDVTFWAEFWGTSSTYPLGQVTVSITDETGTPVAISLMGLPPFQWKTSAAVTARLLPGKDYSMSVATVSGNGKVKFHPLNFSGGQTIHIGGIESLTRTIATAQNQIWKIRVGFPTDFPLEGAPTGLRAGECSSIVADKPVWYLGLGRMRSGESAGAIGFRRADFTGNFFTPSALYYDSPDLAEVPVVRVGGVLRQVYSREVLVDIQTVSTTSYRLDLYPRSQVTGYSNPLYTFTGSPVVSYTIAQITPSGGTGVEIARQEDGVTWKASLELVAAVWTLRDWRTNLASAESKVTTNFTTSTSATIAHKGAGVNGSVSEPVDPPLEWGKEYYQYPWGKELIRTIFGAGETAPVEARYGHYTTEGSGAVYRKLKWMKQPNGFWSKIDYYDTSVAAGDRGLIKRAFRQWLDVAADPNAPSTANSAYEDWTYTTGFDGGVNLPLSRIDYAPGGTLLSKSEWVYNLGFATVNGKTIAQETRREYWSSSGYLSTTTESYRPNDWEPYFRGKLHSVQHPDGRKESYAYFKGTWSEANKEFTGSSNGDDRLILCFHGQTTDGTSVSSATKNGTTWTMSSLNMVVGKSTVSERVVDKHGRLVFEAENVYTSGYAPDIKTSRIAGTIHRFDSHGRELESVDIVRSVGGDELKTVREYSASLLTKETAPEGKSTKFEYDALLRLSKKIEHFVDGLGGPTGYPEKMTEFKYDGANRLAEAYSCSGCGAGATFYEYDGAGRLLVKSEASPEEGGGELATTYSYPSITRVDTTLPSGATRQEDSFLDGRPKSVAGTAQPPATFEYVVATAPTPEVGFLIITRKNGTTTTYGWVEEKHDLLGRLTARSVPTWGWPTYTDNVLETRFEFNTAGQLSRERTYYRSTGQYINADRTFVYDGGGRIWRRGLDVDNNGSLTKDSSDRIVDVDETISQDGWGWQLVTTVNSYATALSATATEISQSYTRLTGFNQGSKSGNKFVIADMVSFDSSDRWSLRWDYANPTSKSIESDFQWQGFPGGYQKGNNGYVSEVLAKNGEKQGYEYDSRGRLSHVRGRWTGSAYAEDTAYAYHGDTQFVASVTHGGIATSYAYAWGSPSGTRKVTATDAAQKTTHTLYNAMDLPWQVWGSAAQPVEFGYDSVGRRTSMTTWRTGSFSGDSWPGSPGTGATTKWDPEPATGLLRNKEWADHAENPASAARKWAYTYTPLGSVFTREWARTITSGPYLGDRVKATYGYSPSTGELTSIAYNDGTPDTSYSYTRTGAPYQITDTTGQRTFVYRADLQLESETLPSGFYGASRTITPTYENGSGGTVNGRATGFQFKNGSDALSANTFTFSASTGLISTVSGLGSASAFNYDYATGANWVGAVTRNDGGYVRTNSLLGNRRVIGKVQTTWSGNVALYDSTIQDGFDSRGLRNKVEQTGSLFNAPLSSGTTTFSHNERGEILGADFDDGTPSGDAKDFTWAYDFMGKRTEASNNSATKTYYNPFAAAQDVNKYQGITGPIEEPDLAYDADGNMTRDGTWHYRYDAENQLKEMEKRGGTIITLQFAYDYLGRRVKKTVRNGGPTGSVTSSTKFVWSGWALTAELNAGTTETESALLKSYLWGVDFSNASGAAGGAGGLLAVYQDSAWHFPVYDAMGNVTGYLNSSGAVAAGYEYNSYGQIVAQRGSPAVFAFGFSTQYTDHETGLVYYGLRYYQPKQGRFINRDPIEEAGGLNLYSLVGNSPANGWDVLGLGDDEDVIHLPPFPATPGERSSFRIPTVCGGYLEIECWSNSGCSMTVNYGFCGEGNASPRWGPSGPDLSIPDFTVAGGVGGTGGTSTSSATKNELVHEDLLKVLCASAAGRAFVQRMNGEGTNIYTSESAFRSKLDLGFFNSTQFRRDGTIDIYVNRAVDTAKEVRDAGYYGGGREGQVMILRHEIGEYDAFRAMPSEPAWVRDAHARYDADNFARSAGIQPWNPGSSLQDLLAANSPSSLRPQGYPDRRPTTAEFAKMIADRVRLIGWDCSRVTSTGRGKK